MNRLVSSVGVGGPARVGDGMCVYVDTYTECVGWVSSLCVGVSVSMDGWVCMVPLPWVGVSA